MGRRAGEGGGGGGGGGGKLEAKVTLSAIVLADSFTQRFRPVTVERPKVLLPLAGAPLLEYTLEWLALNRVDEIFVFCCAHADQIKRYLASTKWGGGGGNAAASGGGGTAASATTPSSAGPRSSSSPLLPKVTTVVSTGCLSVGDALRHIDQADLVKGDFILVTGDTVANLDLSAAVAAHRARRAKDRAAVATLLLRPAGAHGAARLRTGDAGLVVALDAQTRRLLRYVEVDPPGCGRGARRAAAAAAAAAAATGEDGGTAASAAQSAANPAASVLRLDCAALFSERDAVAIRTDLVDTGVAVCAPEVLMLFTDNFDYQSLRRDLVPGVLSEEELGNKLFAHVLPGNEYAARVHSLRTYDAVARDVLRRWAFPFAPDTNWMGAPPPPLVGGAGGVLSGGGGGVSGIEGATTAAAPTTPTSAAKASRSSSLMTAELAAGAAGGAAAGSAAAASAKPPLPPGSSSAAATSEQQPPALRSPANSFTAAAQAAHQLPASAWGAPTYRLGRGNVYAEADVSVARSAQVGPRAAIGAGTAIAAGARVSGSVLGRGCRVGRGAVVIGSYLGDGVVVGDGARVEYALVCDRAVLREGSSVGEGAVVSFGVVVGARASVPAYARVSLCRQGGGIGAGKAGGAAAGNDDASDESEDEVEYASSVGRRGAGMMAAAKPRGGGVGGGSAGRRARQKQQRRRRRGSGSSGSSDDDSDDSDSSSDASSSEDSSSSTSSDDSAAAMAALERPSEAALAAAAALASGRPVPPPPPGAEDSVAFDREVVGPGGAGFVWNVGVGPEAHLRFSIAPPPPDMDESNVVGGLRALGLGVVGGSGLVAASAVDGGGGGGGGGGASSSAIAADSDAASQHSSAAPTATTQNLERAGSYGLPSVRAALQALRLAEAAAAADGGGGDDDDGGADGDAGGGAAAASSAKKGDDDDDATTESTPDTDEDSDDSDDDSVEDHDGGSGDGSEGSEAGGDKTAAKRAAAAARRKEAAFMREVSETFLRVVRDRIDPDNAVIELNGLKIAEVRTFADCAKYLVSTMLSLGFSPCPPRTPREFRALYPADAPATPAALLRRFATRLAEWKPVLRRFLRDEEDQVELLLTLEEYCGGGGAFKAALAPGAASAASAAFAPLLQLLYKEDVLSEEAILAWADEKEGAGEKDRVYLAKAQAFVDWLREEEDDEDEEDEESEE